MKKLLILMILFPLVCFGQTRPHWSQVRTDNDGVNLKEYLTQGDLELAGDLTGVNASFTGDVSAGGVELMKYDGSNATSPAFIPKYVENIYAQGAALGEVASYTLMKITTTARTETFHAKLDIYAQAGGTTQARRLRHLALEFIVVTSASGRGVVEIKNTETLSDTYGGGDRDPIAMDARFVVDGDDIYVLITTGNTLSSANIPYVMYGEINMASLANLVPRNITYETFLGEYIP